MLYSTNNKSVPNGKYFYLRYILFKIFNWKIIAFLPSVGFYHTATCISHMYTYVPSLLNSLPSSRLPPPGLSQSARLSFLCSWAAAAHELPVSHMVVYMFQCHPLNLSHPLLPLLCPQVCSQGLCLFLPCK